MDRGVFGDFTPWKGKDGKYYESYHDMLGADTRYDQMERLIEAQEMANELQYLKFKNELCDDYDLYDYGLYDYDLNKIPAKKLQIQQNTKNFNNLSMVERDKNFLKILILNSIILFIILYLFMNYNNLDYSYFVFLPVLIVYIGVPVSYFVSQLYDNKNSENYINKDDPYKGLSKDAYNAAMEKQNKWVEKVKRTGKIC